MILQKPTNNKTGNWVSLSKAFYFFYFAAMATLLPFLVLYFNQLGLSGRQIGTLTGMAPLMTLISASFWGGVADSTQQHQRVLWLTIVGAVVFALIISVAQTFWWLLLLVIGYAFLAGPIIPLIDSTVLTLLGKQTAQYGRIRLWGAVGWGISAPIAGWLIEQSGLRWSFYSFGILMMILLLVAVRLPVQKSRIGGTYWTQLGILLRNRQWALFLLVIFIGGMGLAIIHNYLFLYMQDLGAGKVLMGLALSAATLSEMLVFLFSERLMVRWGTRSLLIIGLLSMTIRLIGCSFVYTPWVVLLFQLLHGPSFAMMWVASVSYAGKMAPPGMEATTQGLLSSVNFGLGAAVGAFLGGTLYQQLGPHLMFRWAGIGVLTGLLIFITAERLFVENI